jgi:N-acetylglucosaminyl-diphospho-decaprenol L-rhamnosyltransferase
MSSPQRITGHFDGGPGSISISVVSHGQAHLVTSLLADISRHVRPPFEVILTLNLPEGLDISPGSHPFPIRILENARPKGFAANHNAAFRASRGEIFCVLNPDIRLEGDPFPRLIESFDDPSIGVVAPLIRDPAGALEDSARRFPTSWSILRKALRCRVKIDYPIQDRTFFPDWVAGMFMVFPREVFEALGGFDERFFLYYEDVDLCARLASAGRRAALCPQATAVHAARRKSRRDLRHFGWHLSSMLRYFFRYPIGVRNRERSLAVRTGDD